MSETSTKLAKETSEFFDKIEAGEFTCYFTNYFGYCKAILQSLNIWSLSNVHLCVQLGNDSASGTEKKHLKLLTKRPGAKGLPEFVPESPLQKGVFESHIFSKESEGKRTLKICEFWGKTLWEPLARPAPFVYFRTLNSSSRNFSESRLGCGQKV